jgi:lysophospholipase L1-like esterase
MTRNKSILSIAAASLLSLSLAVPSFAAARGSADFTRFVAIGDSYGAGFESGSLNERHQVYSWPAVIARQAGAPDFQQPLISYPGLGSELVLNDIISYPPVIVPAAGTAVPLNLGLARAYNNLSIPGATVGDVITLNGTQPVTGTATSFAQLVLRGKGTEVQQALSLNPTFIAVWIGGNDVLGALLNGSTKFLNTTANFTTAYNTMLDQLVAGAPNAGIVVGTLPTNVNVAPFATTSPTVIINPATRQPVLGSNGLPISYIGELGDGTVGLLPAGSYVTLSGSSFLASGYGIPAALAQVPPFNQLPNVGKPLPDAVVVTPTEAAAISARAVEFNAVIRAAAAARNIPVVDIDALFNRVRAGYQVGPMTFTSSFITGGFFNLDGFHLTDAGYTLFADEYIRTINANYGTHIPLAGIASLLQNNGANFGLSTSSGLPVQSGTSFTVSPEAAKAMTMTAPTLATPTHRRATGN